VEITQLLSLSQANYTDCKTLHGCTTECSESTGCISISSVVLDNFC
jgi:hypothetical protein